MQKLWSHLKVFAWIFLNAYRFISLIALKFKFPYLMYRYYECKAKYIERKSLNFTITYFKIASLNLCRRKL